MSDVFSYLPLLNAILNTAQLVLAIILLNEIVSIHRKR